MAQAQRPDPEALLSRVEEEEKRRDRGRLKVFLGYAAGVGKTYAMLEAAQQRKAEGVDVVVAYAETHGRAETEEMLAGLEIVPRQRVAYRGVTLEEMDLDAVLARAPQLVLVDELAHTNAPGSRHRKRYLDVEELLAAGIDVYTTLNIQHVESLNDVVAQITGVRMRETVPDRLLDDASEIELIDLPPEELRQRLKDGKVYVPDQAAHAVQKFFRPGNLLALREMALRRVADRVDEQMRAYMVMRAIPGPWPAADRLLVCVGPNPLAERMVRTARQIADDLNAEWFALYVETPQHLRLPLEARERVWRTLQLAESLGATTASQVSEAVAEGIVDYARRLNITKIVVGKPLKPRWREWLAGSIVDQIIRRSGDIDVYVISSSESAAKARRQAAGGPPARWRDVLAGAALVALATLLGQPFREMIAPTNLVMLYLAAVVLAAVSFGLYSAVLAAVLSVLAFDVFFVPPRYTLAVSDTQYLLTFAGLLIVGVVISTLVSQTRAQAQAARRREEQTAALYALSRDLAAAIDLDGILRSVVQHTSDTFSRAVAILLLKGDKLAVAASSPILRR